MMNELYALLLIKKCLTSIMIILKLPALNYEKIIIRSCDYQKNTLIYVGLIIFENFFVAVCS